MNLRKIIKEEVDEFDWIRDIPVFNLNSLWVIDNDINDSKGIQDYLFTRDWGWDFPNDDDRYEYINSKYYFNVVGGNEPMSFDAYDKLEAVERNLPDHTIWKWSDVKNDLIKESDEFDWIRDTNPIETVNFDDLVGIEVVVVTVTQQVGQDTVYTIGKKDSKNRVGILWSDIGGQHDVGYPERDMRSHFMYGSPPEEPVWQFRFKDEGMNKTYNIPNVFKK